MADGWTIDESAGDHEPTHECFRNNQHAHNEIDAEFLERYFFGEDEIEHGDWIDQCDQSRKKAMDPFHEKDEFIFIQSHGRVYLDILSRFLIFVEFKFPVLRANV